MLKIVIETKRLWESFKCEVSCPSISNSLKGRTRKVGKGKIPQSMAHVPVNDKGLHL